MTTLTPAESAPASLRAPMLQVGVLTLLFVVLIRSDLSSLLANLPSDPESAHLAIMPLLIGLLWWRRRDVIRREATRGAMLGLVVMLVGVAIYVFCAFPFNYLQPRRMAIAVMIAGALLYTIGWRATLRWVPMLMILVLSIPIGMRFFASLIVRPETITLQVVTTLLDAVSGAEVWLDGLDILYRHDMSDVNAIGTVALGEPNRGAQYPLALATMIIFVTFSRVRPWWQLVVAAIAALPILFIANAARLFVWGMVTILTDAHPLALTPRHAGILTSVAVATFGLGVIYFVCDNLVRPDPTEDTA